MIDKLKTKFIHMLGGYTKAEQRENGKKSFNVGVLTMLYDMKNFADHLYGFSADEWCKQMYQRIEKGIQHQENSTH